MTEIAKPSARTHRAPVIGLTGTIGAGKSTVADILRSLGCLVSDSDRLARAAFDDPAVRSQLVERWRGIRGADGQIGVTNPDGTLRRDAVAAIVFGDSDERRWLEGVVHPWIRRERERLFAGATPEIPALVIDAPLLLEAGLQDECDTTWVVDAPRSLRAARLAATRGWDETEFARREAAQWTPQRKRAAASVVIENDTTVAALRENVTHELDRLLSAE